MLLGREVSNLLAIGEEEGVPQHEECLGLRARHRGEGALERGGLAHLEEVQLHLQRLGGALQREQLIR